jgi:heptosyltransferase-2
MPPLLADAQRVLVVTKFRYLGDTIVATPFLRRLQEVCPEAAVTLLTGPALPILLQGCPYLNDIWTFDPKNPGGWRSNRQLISRIRAAQFDTAFLLNRSLHSAWIAASARIPQRIGFDTEFRGLLLTTRVPYRRDAREIDCYLDLLRAVGVEAEYRLPELWVTAEERQRAREILKEAGAKTPLPRPLILLQPGAKDPYKKQWEAARFAAVADGLAQHFQRGDSGGLNASFALIGAKEEEEACAQVAALSRVPFISLAGRTDLREALALLAEADLLIANDTALVHAAAALNTPTVSVQGPQTSAKWGYDAPHRVMTVPALSGRADRHANRRALDALPPEPVLEAALSVLRASGASSPH